MKEADYTTHPWRGYTLDELRVRRIVNLAHIEIEETRLKQMTERFTSKSPIKSGTPILSKMFKALDYVDYAVLAYRLGGKLLSMFRHKRR